MNKLGTIRRNIQLGKRLQREFPEIAEDYREGMFLADIAREYYFASMFGVKEDTARIIVRHAIKGHDGKYGVKSYQGLITDASELERISSENDKRRAETAGKNSLRDKKGIHSQTDDERRKLCLDGVRARGLVPWIERIVTEEFCKFSEIEFAYILSQSPEYQTSYGVNNKIISERLNEVYHNNALVRNARAVKVALTKYRKSIRDKRN